MTDILDIEVKGLLRDEGTVFVFHGFDLENGDGVTFAADHRPAGDILQALVDAYEREEGDREAIVAAVPTWAVLSRQVAS